MHIQKVIWKYLLDLFRHGSVVGYEIDTGLCVAFLISVAKQQGYLHSMAPCFWFLAITLLARYSSASHDCDLSYSGITYLNASVFVTCPSSSSSLNLRGNSITHVTNDSFAQYFYNLDTLDLSENRIQLIEPKSFSDLRTLISLNLSNNFIEQLYDGIFDNKYNLQTVDLSYNAIKHVGNGVFRPTQPLYSLKHVNMSHNNLTTFEPWPYILPRGRDHFFDVSHNKISAFTNQLNWEYDLVEPYNTEVDLSYNELKYWDDSYVKQYSLDGSDYVLDFVTLNMDIRHNPLVCDCNLHYIAHRLQESFYKYADTTIAKVQCVEPPELRGEFIIETVYIDNFVCNVSDDCPPGCLCQDRPAEDILKVTCDNWNHTKLPEVLPSNNYKKLSLSMDNNYISTVALRNYTNELVTLSLRNNRIQYVEKAAAGQINISIIQSIDLAKNKLASLPEDMRYIRYDIINVNNNPFICDCDMTWMADWIKLSQQDNVNRNIECTFESEHTFKIIDVTDSKLNCNYDVEIGLAVAFGFLLVIVLVIVVWAKRCPYETKVLLYKFLRIHPRDKYIVDQCPLTDTDLYISFDSEDIYIRQWVIRKLAKRLEEEKPIYKVFVPVRDLVIGEETAGNIIEQMEKSKRILIILSDKYEENEWCRFECQRAEILDFIEGRIMFLTYHPEATDLIQKEPWKSRVKGRKVFSPGETKSEKRWFWDKLRYELPVHR